MATETISEDKFEAFSKYDFDNDEEYKTGLATILKRAGDDASAETVEKAKVFYFNKFIQPLTLDELHAWKASKRGPEAWGQRQPVAAPETPTPSRPTDQNEDGKEIGHAPQSVKFTFQELVEMIESGQEIPGIRQIPNKINEGPPSEAKMPAPRKPWEQQQK